MENLWPKIEEKEFKTPATILAEQGKYLEKMTNGVLSYEVKTNLTNDVEFDSGTASRVDFYIHAPLLGDYKFLLVYLIHDFILPYPISLGDFEDGGRYAYEPITKEEEFLETLAGIFSREKTQLLIQNLYGRSKNSQKSE